MTWNAPDFTRRLAKTVRTFDREGATRLCQELIDHLRRVNEIYPEPEARRILEQLRRKRYFGLMQQVADAFIRSGQDVFQVRRQYAQSLLDQDNLTAAMNVLQVLVMDTANYPGENAEARGLMGRAHKQLYVEAKDSTSPRSKRNLEQAARWYYKVYEDDPQGHLWHGINTVALVCRAERDFNPLNGFPNARDLAREILKEVEVRDLDRRADMWDFGTALEACVALGQGEEALRWTVRYVGGSSADAFELASTHRQLTEVWQLNTDSEPGASLLPILRAELLKREGGQLDVSSGDLSSDALHRRASGGQLERVLGNEGFVTLKWFETALERCRAVARIDTEDEEAVGTGFLVRGQDFHHASGDKLLLLTNSHVISNQPEVRGARRPDEVVITFQALNPLDGVPEKYKVEKVLWESPPGQLDATLVQLQKPVDNVAPYPIAANLPLIQDGDPQRVYIIGHPKGRPLSFSIYDNLLLGYESPFLHYRTPTEGGSSGSPVFTRNGWRLVAIHHKGGVTRRNASGEPETSTANEGIWIQAIIQAMAKDPPH